MNQQEPTGTTKRQQRVNENHKELPKTLNNHQESPRTTKNNKNHQEPLRGGPGVLMRGLELIM